MFALTQSQIGAIPFVFSILIELFSPWLTKRFTRILDAYIEDLDESRIGSDAEEDIKEFARYAFEVLQMYTAVAVTAVSGLTQLFTQSGFSFWVMLVLVVIVSLQIGILFTKSVMQDPALYDSFTDRYYIPPTALATVPVNVLFIVLILTA